MPHPRLGETKDKFISRCMRYKDLQGKPEKQRLGECEGLWSEKHKDSKSGFDSDSAFDMKSYVAPEILSYIYDVKSDGLPGTDIVALDCDSPKEITFDQSKMSATGVLATTSLDRYKDILEVKGINTFNHQRNPIAMVDHAQWCPLPIGKCMTDDGIYLVTIDEEAGEALQTTLFSQSLPLARQLYCLYVEKILRANSIGFTPTEVKNLNITNPYTKKPGRHIIRCDLDEVTWCARPVNQDCVMKALSMDKIEGRPLEPVLKSVLTRYAADKKIWANGFSQANLTLGATNMPEAKKAMSSISETNGGALIKKSETAEKPKDEAQGKAEEKHGAEFLRAFHDDLSDLMEQHGEGMSKLENKAVSAHMTKTMESMENCLSDTCKTFDKEYPEAEPLVAKKSKKSKEDESEDADSGKDEDEEQETARDKEEDSREKSLMNKFFKKFETVLGVAEGKKMNKATAGNMSDLKDMLDGMLSMEGLDATTKSALKHHKSWIGEALAKNAGPGRAVDDTEGIEGEEEAELEEEDLTEEEEKALVELDRKLQAQLRMFGRMGVKV